MHEGDQLLPGGAGMPDRWERLWAPHRMEYLKGENRPLVGNEVTCPFCDIPKMSDEDGLIVGGGDERRERRKSWTKVSTLKVIVKKFDNLSCHESGLLRAIRFAPRFIVP